MPTHAIWKNKHGVPSELPESTRYTLTSICTDGLAHTTPREDCQGFEYTAVLHHRKECTNKASFLRTCIFISKNKSFYTLQL